MSYLTHYRSLQGRFYRSGDPTNSVAALKDSKFTMSMANTSRLGSVRGREINTDFWSRGHSFNSQ